MLKCHIGLASEAASRLPGECSTNKQECTVIYIKILSWKFSSKGNSLHC